MPRKAFIRILILEENQEWRNALADMYTAIVGSGCEVLTAGDEPYAEQVLRNGAVDLLTLDLNLTHGHRDDATGPLKCDSGRLRLIEIAAKKRWAKAVVLIVRNEAHAEERFVVCDQPMLDEATVSPQEFVRRRFPDRGLVLNKPAHWDLPTSLAHFAEVIQRRLPDLTRAADYTLRFGGTAHDQRVTVVADRRHIAALEGSDALLLASLVIVDRASEFLSDRSVVEIYRGRAEAEAPEPALITRLAQREIDGLRRRLQRLGIDDRALLRRIRRSDSAASANLTGAWRIDGSVLTEGMSTLNVRARGGKDFRPDVANPNDP